jgi:hypothetical protein
MMRASLALGVAVAVAGTSGGCVRVVHETRTERGPVLRSFEREVPTGVGGVMARVVPRYPELELAFSAYELCRQERVEEIIEEQVTESSAPQAGPAFALGVAGTVVGAGLWGFRSAFSDQPDTRRIDEEGRHPPSPRQAATTWGTVLLVVGIPALVTGVVGLQQSGERVQGRRLEQVASSLEVPCRTSPIDGEVMLERATGPQTVTVRTEGGKVTLSAQALQNLRLASVHFNGAPVLLPEEEAHTLEAFLACGQALPPLAGDVLGELPEGELVARYNATRRCAQVAPEAAGDAVRALEGEIHRRRGSSLSPVGRAPATFDEAVQAWPPGLRLEAGHPDLAQLERTERLAGRTVYARGRQVQRVDGNVALLDVGGHPLLVFVPPDATWPSYFPDGTWVEVLGVVVGRQALGQLEAPLLRAMWMRSVDGGPSAPSGAPRSEFQQ